MPFDPSKFEASIFLLLLLTAGMMFVRLKAKLDNNWPVLYWLLLLYISYTRTDTWDFNVVAAGAVAALLLRYEFMVPGLITAFQLVEFGIWGYILYEGCRILFY